MKMKLVDLRKAHLKYLEDLQTNDKLDHFCKIYLNACIENLRSEIVGRREKAREKANIIHLENSIVAKIHSLNYFDSDTEIILGYLLTNDHPLKVVDIYAHSKMDRGKIYRSIQKLIALKIAIRVNGVVSTFVLVDRKNPLQFLVLEKSKELERIKGMSFNAVAN